ncbi:MAG: peptidylprolyl isomerase [Planctomycetota bacterium]
MSRSPRQWRFLMMVSVVASCTAAGCASAQLVPDRLYYGVDRAIPMTATAGDAADPDGTVRVLLFDGSVVNESAEPVLVGEAALGEVDLAVVFPDLWQTKRRETLFAQLEVGGDRIGPAVVLQPLLSVDNALGTDPQTQQMSFMSDRNPNRRVVYSGLRVYQERLAVLKTDKGDVTLRLRPDAAPNTAFNFRHLSEGGFYTDIIFHRVVETLTNGNPFVVQVGDPTGTGGGGPGYQFDLEPSPIAHEFGVVSMARTSDPNTNGSQFFIALGEVSFLDRNYTTFGEVVNGGEAVIAISRVPVGSGDRPLEPPVLESVELVDAPPFGTVDMSRVERPEEPGVER